MHEQLTEWWNGVSLRSKITGVTVMLLTLGLLVAGVGTMSFLRNYQLDGVDAKIKATAADPSTAYLLACDGSTKMIGPYFMGVVNSQGTLTCSNGPTGAAVPVINSSTLPAVLEKNVPFTLTDKLHTTQWRAMAVPSAKLTGTDTQVALIIAVNLDDTNELVGHYALIFLFFSLTVVVLGGALTRLLVTSTFAPLREVEDTAARFAAGDFSQRLGVAPRNTEVGRLNGSLNTMLSRIDEAFADRVKTVEQMRRFVGDASHELRTPLVSVRGYAELYRMGALATQEEVAQAMGRIEKEAIRMGELVQDLLELARIDEAKPLNLAAVDLVPLARDAALDAMASNPDRDVTVVVTEPIRSPFVAPETSLSPVAPATAAARTRAANASAKAAAAASAAANPRAANLTTRPIALAGATLARMRRPRRPKELAAVTVVQNDTLQTDAMVLAEENKIRQVITNLMGNALRFTDPTSPIEIGITIDEPNDSAIIAVVDHGEGIPPQIREKIFQRFWRADSSRNRDTGGSGLGLAIVASIVASHKGTVDVVETPGGGATFRVHLPLLHPVTPTLVAPSAG
jgi:two-component system OmpR family sensor kinase